MERPNTHAYIYEDAHTHERTPQTNKKGVGREEGKKREKEETKQGERGKKNKGKEGKLFSGGYRSVGTEEDRTSY